MIYTLCVEPIDTNLRAELHLYRFRTIIRVLSLHPYFGPRGIRPTTTWSHQQSSPGRSFPSTIAFGTTCSGTKVSKPIISAARLAFAKSLLTSLYRVRRQGYSLVTHYSPGNCPAWIAYIIFCRRPGQYNSICVTMSDLKIYKLCGYCVELQSALADVGIEVYDLWAESGLGIGRAQELDERVAFSFRRLMDYSQLQEKYGGISGV